MTDTQLYIQQGEYVNGKVAMPANAKDILAYFVANPAIANKVIGEYSIANPSVATNIWMQVEDNNYEVWLKEVYQEVAEIRGISLEEATELVDEAGEAESLYQSGMNIVAEVANELSITIDWLLNHEED